MHTFFASILSHMEIVIEHGGYLVLFLVSILEGVPIIGPFVPGHTIVILSGFLSKIGVLDLVYVLALSMSGAFIGDMLGFMCGRKFGFVFLNRFGKYFFIKDQHVEKVKHIVQKHSGKSIILGRFSPLTRALTPYITGASGVSLRSFWFFDLIGVILWATTSIGLGFVFGASYKAAAVFFGKFMLVAIVIGVFMAWSYHFINRQFHIFARYELITLFLNLCGLYAFFKMIQDALVQSSAIVGFDVWFNLVLLSHTKSYLVSFFVFMTNTFSPTSLMLLVIVGICYFLYKKQWRYAVISLASYSGGMFLSGFIKEMVLRARPVDALVHAGGYSFPSGHATAIMIVCVIAIYTLARKFSSTTKREIFIVSLVLLTALIGFSRLYLGVHWFSDVIGGFALGLFWTTFVILAVRYLGMFVQNYLHLGDK